MRRVAERGERRINVLIALAGLGFGGAEVVVQRLISAIDRRRFNPVICCMKVIGPIGERLVRDGEEVIVLAGKGQERTDYFRFLKLLKVLRERRIDVVHTHTTDALADAAVCRLLMPGLKIVHTFHFGNYPHRSSRDLLMERVFSRLATRLVAVGEVQREQLLETFGFRPRSVQVVRNGVARPADDADPRIERFKAQFAGGVVVGNICTLIEQKGLLDFLAVARNVHKVRPEVKFVLVGDGHLRPQLEARITEYGLAGCVTLAGWTEDAAKVALPAIDIFFQPSLWEAMSIALLEAMMAGKPAVASSVGEARFMIEDGKDGMLVAPRDIEAMTSALLKLVDEPALRAQMGQAAATKVMEVFSIPRMTQGYEAIYSGCVA